MNRNKKVVVELPSDHEILITRTFDAPRELVYRAHTDPALVPLWWGPKDTKTIVEQLDVRPGGRWRYVHQVEGAGEFVFSGEFREVVPNERLVQTAEFDQAPGQVVIETTTFEERDGRTTITVLQQCPSKEARDAMLATGMDEGLNESYERLDAWLAEQQVSVNGKEL